GDTALLVAGYVVAALSTTLVIVVATLRATLLAPSYWDRGLSGARAYDRIYTEVLADPELERVTHDLFGGLPVSRSFIDSNLRTVLPPSTLRDFMNAAVKSVTDFLKG